MKRSGDSKNFARGMIISLLISARIMSRVLVTDDCESHSFSSLSMSPNRSENWPPHVFETLRTPNEPTYFTQAQTKHTRNFIQRSHHEHDLKHSPKAAMYEFVVQYAKKAIMPSN